MSKFSNISWKLCIDERSCDKNRCCFWTYELNADWKMKCACKPSQRQNLALIEIHRTLLAGECMIWGTLEIHDETKKQCLQVKRFIHLLEDQSPCMKIDLQSVKLSAKMFLINGEITVSANTYASLDLYDLAHMTDSDYSSLKQLSTDMGKLLTGEPVFADVILKCESVSIPAHKSILSARSPVFKYIFDGPMKESLGNEIIIKDLKVPVLQAMLKYIYTGIFEDFILDGDLLFVASLLLAAILYGIESLEASCGKHLLLNMSIKHGVGEFLILALFSPQMKHLVIDFLPSKFTDYSWLEKTDEWIFMKKFDPSLALEILSNVVKSQERELKTRL